MVKLLGLVNKLNDFMKDDFTVTSELNSEERVSYNGNLDTGILPIPLKIMKVIDYVN
jgi:hypothetical protein